MGAWIEIMSITVGTGNAWSHPTMGAWIEIHRGMVTYQKQTVAPHDGCVD